jgi:hypothetical protein
MNVLLLAVLLLPGLNALAAKPATKPAAKPAAKSPGVRLSQLTELAPIIFLARCPQPAKGCKNEKGDRYQFIKVRTLKGKLEPANGTILVELASSKPKVPKNKRPLVSGDYQPSVTLEQSGRTDLILFLTPAEKGSFRFVTASAYESGAHLSDVNAALLKSSK